MQKIIRLILAAGIIVGVLGAAHFWGRQPFGVFVALFGVALCLIELLTITFKK